MAADPAQAQRQHQAELAAALLLLGRRYDLPALIRTNGIRPRPFRQIRPTAALRSTMASPYMDLVRAWAAEQPALMAGYEQAARSGNLAIVRRQVEASAGNVQTQLAVLERRFPTIMADLERWHRGQWLQRVQSATGVNVGMFTSAQDVATATGNAVTWNQQLLGDVHAQAKGGISAALLAGVALSSPAAVQTAINGVLGKAKKRGLNIGVDQVDRTVTAMTRARRDAAGLTSFIWHHAHVRFPRPEHVARDGQTFTERNAPSDRAGLLYGCQCWEEPTFD